MILGLIAVGSFYSYTFVHQRVFSQRQHRFALGLLQGWMEYAISSLHDPNDPLVIVNNHISSSLNEKEGILSDKFKKELVKFNDGYSDLLTDTGYNITLKDSDKDPYILREIINDQGVYDDMVEIRLSIILSKNNDADLPVTLYTKIYLDPNIYTTNNR